MWDANWRGGELVATRGSRRKILLKAHIKVKGNRKKWKMNQLFWGQWGGQKGWQWQGVAFKQTLYNWGEIERKEGEGTGKGEWYRNVRTTAD